MFNPLVSSEAEQAVLGSVLTRPQVWDDVAFLTDDDFAFTDHRDLWSLMRGGERFRDFVTLMTAAETADRKIYIAELARNAIHAGNVKFYAQIVRERSSLRKLSAACTGILSRIDANTPAADAIAAAVREIEAIGESTVIGKGPRHVSEIGGEWYEAFKARAASDGKLVGMSTGFRDLDARWGGLRGGQMIVIAGRPKRGKSTLAANIAQHVARTTPVLVFNMEMSANEILDRAVSFEGQIDIGDIRNGTLSSDAWNGLLDAWTGVAASKLHIDDTPSQTIDSIRMAARAFVKRHGQSLIVIDYLQLVRGDQRQSSYERVSEVSRGVKLLAKECDSPVISLVQMNRAIEAGARKPQLSDLRDSGAIEQDADIIAFCHQDLDDQGHCEFITRAMRSGQAGADYLMRDFRLSRFVSAHPGFMPEQPKQDAKPQRKRGGFDGGEA